MISLWIAFAVLVVGYLLYSRVTEKVFATDGRKTPALEKSDGVDCVPMKTWKAFLVQLLNIAGTGPIFGALMGAVFGPIVFLWIVFGSVLGGAVHDFMSAVTMTYFLTSSEGFRLSVAIADPVGGAFVGALFVAYLVLLMLNDKKAKVREASIINQKEGESK